MTSPSQEQPVASQQHSVRHGVAAVTSIGAGVLLLTVGTVSLLQGIAAVIDDEIFVVGVEYVYRIDTTSWGWIHIVLGAVLMLCSVGLMMGTAWGRGAAIGFAALSIVANFLWLPYYPWWSVLIIALDVVVIWAVATWKPR
ncbi:hypothetical protein IU501_28025 [Nocardia otitidiscaviarum]|uniref:DUF7144 family membrane protein n=1 Tax=Nocardia otitidiscaviarum TaxID=1823 RepID=UPI0004A71ECB|nr:hypothetical protein [Nocardia otitidiscaviarum]MBF6136832.1 hypothetical protein [Nocardia otitidiscaviarum]MBF6485035.1 hypothetical protein [Nocardia otitidiscaviarum]